MKLSRLKSGDTLIEVTLAVGIFSMVAVAVVSVINSNLSNAQVDLETTVAREQIDAQAEALRFIQNAHITNMNNDKTSVYDTLWNNYITKNAVTQSTFSSKYNPTPKTCSEIYDGRLTSLKAFVLNINKMGSGNASDIYVSADTSISKNGPTFSAAATYPRLVYGNETTEEDINTGLSNQDVGTKLYRVEGLYVVAVKDNNTTQIIDGSSTSKKSAFYDFYITSCWYGPGSDTPSTISTVVRLYNPVVVQ